jgi:hypothetical protein
VLTSAGTWSVLRGNWSEELFATEDDIKRWDKWGASVGLQARAFPGLDIDVEDARLADLCSRIVVHYLGLGPVRTCTGSLRRLHMFKCSGLRWVRLPFVDRSGVKHTVELLAKGQCYVVEGPHPKGGEYVWTGGHPCDVGPAGIPEINATAVRACFSALRAALISEGCTIREAAVAR